MAIHGRAPDIQQVQQFGDRCYLIAPLVHLVLPQDQLVATGPGAHQMYGGLAIHRNEFAPCDLGQLLCSAHEGLFEFDRVQSLEQVLSTLGSVSALKCVILFSRD